MAQVYPLRRMDAADGDRGRKRTEKTMTMARTGWILAVALGVALPAAAQREETERLRNATTVMRAIFGMPDGIPRELLDRAECVIVVPSVKKLALGVGGSYGRGAMSCRGGATFEGPWGPPSMFALEGASFGFQIGGTSTDFVLLVMNEGGAESVLASKVKIGADASAAAGPKGRSAGAATDIVMRAEMLTYSRARGLFAGVSLEGSTLRADNDANTRLYGRVLNARDIVRGGEVAVPQEARGLIDLLNRRSPKNLSKHVGS
jgi:SH3 domain-containing YSC84-like protein 1